jgi:hypothetical protein
MQQGNARPRKQGLYDPDYERDACGVGFVAHLKGERSRISFSEETGGEDDFETHQEGSGHSAD